MGNMAVTVLKWTIRIPLVIMMIAAFLVLYNLLIAVINVGVNWGIVHELLAMVQLWLPFNIGQVFNWLTSVAVLIIYFKICQFGYNTLNGMIKE